MRRVDLVLCCDDRCAMRLKLKILLRMKTVEASVEAGRKVLKDLTASVQEAYLDSQTF